MVIRASRAVSLCRFTTTTGALSLSLAVRQQIEKKKEEARTVLKQLMATRKERMYKVSAALH